MFPVNLEKNRELRERMDILGIREEDLEEKFIRSSGSGGQKVNKTSTGVYLKHLPTGVEVKWMTERSQSLNRFFARRELVNRVARLSGQMADHETEIKKVRKRKSKRQKRAKRKYHQMDL